MMRVADYFAHFLAERGVSAAFMVSGGQMMHLIDAISRVPSVRYYCGHHEQACAMAADAYARLTGRVGLCYATGGPGGTNVITGLVGAYQDSIPIVFLTGQCKVRDTIQGNGFTGLRQMGMFEVDIVSIVSSVTKYAAFVDRPEDARYHMEKAYHLATSGRPGPVLLDVPLDVQGAQIDPAKQRPFTGHRETVRATPDLSVVHDALRDAVRPLIFAGHGIRCAGAIDSFRLLARELQIPVVTTQLAKDLLAYNDPLFVGHPGIKGDRAANLAVQSSDLILVLGSSLHIQNIGWETDQFAPHARKIHIDPDPLVLRKTRTIVSDQIECPVEQFIEHFITSPEIARDSGIRWNWLERTREWKHRFASTKEPHVLGSLDSPLNLYEVVDALSDVIAENAVVLTDAGQPTYVVPQAYRLKESQRFLAPGSLAEMGWALPAAIGAAAANPSREVVAIIGDGSLQTNIHELQTLRHNGFNVKILVVNNGGYASIRSTQNRFFAGHYVGSTSESGVSLPDLAKLAAAYELPYEACRNRRELHSCLRATFGQIGPVLLEVHCQKNQDIIPIVASRQLPDGRMSSAALHMMSPYISDEEMSEILSNINAGSQTVLTPDARACRAASKDGLAAIVTSVTTIDAAKPDALAHEGAQCLRS
jgi:acetolactate synthase-1/2/3 large subunit